MDDIIVAIITHTYYVHVMKKSSDIVTVEGGMKSYAPIVCREFGIPDFVCLKNVMKVIKNGDFVEVDCNKGYIRKLTR